MKLRRQLLCLFVIAWLAQGSIAHAQANSSFRMMEIEVLDSDGKPLKEASINVTAGEIDFPLFVDDEGIATLNMPEDAANLTLLASCRNYVPLEVRWRIDNAPQRFTFKMEKGETIGGIVHDERGKPIAGVKVEGLVVSPRVSSEGEARSLIGGELATTDVEGKWQANVATPEPVELRLKLSHDKYVSDASYGKRRVSDAKLRSLEHVEVLRDRLPPQGVVLDADGKLAPDVAVHVVKEGEVLTLENGEPVNGSDSVEATTDASGRYQFAEPEQGYLVLCLAEAGWAVVPNKKYEKNEPVEIQLTPWSRVVGVLTHNGEPVALENLQLKVFENRFTIGRSQIVWNNFALTNEKGEFTFERLTNGHANLGSHVEYCGSTDHNRDKFSNETSATLQPGVTTKVTLVRDGPLVTGTVVPLLYDGSEAAIECGVIVLAKQDEAADIVRNIFFEWGKSASAGVQFDPMKNAALSEDPPKPSYAARVERDGTFRFSSLPLGKYTARVYLWTEADDEDDARWVTGSIWEPFTVAQSEGAKDSKVSLGLMEFEVYEADE